MSLHPTLPTETAAPSGSSPTRGEASVGPEKVSRGFLNRHRSRISPAELRGGFGIHVVGQFSASSVNSADIAWIRPELAAEGAALVAALCARAERRVS